ncbi:MAG: thermonuclease family protein [Prevotellaceae bacterium]|nr:thermonuclease family protein [Prevotellaceae bacterium]
MLLLNGMAWHYKRYDKSPGYAAAEDYARTYKIGLWSSPAPIAPWDYREGEREQRRQGRSRK